MKRLAEQSRQAEQMWNLLVPERNIGYTGVIGLVALIIALHTYNSYNAQHKIVDSLPAGAKERLPNGSYLMKDGSIQALEHTPSPTKVAVGIGESTLMLDRILARFKP